VIEALKKRMEEALRDLRACSNSRVHIFHHNDADGLTSGAILTRAFEREGFTVHRSALEKPYPAVLEKVFHKDGEVLIFADFAGRIAPYLSGLNQGRNLVLILDHHTAVESTDPRVYNLDPDLFGLKGDVDIPASVTCHMFARVMDERNTDLAHLAALGAIGDKFLLEGKLVSENRKAVLEAVEQETIRIEEKGRGEDYLFRTSKGEIPGASLAGYLETLGAVGYYQDGPETAIEVCLKGISEESDRLHRAFLA
jgi:single-stranded-DNA-specific exonuclease